MRLINWIKRVCPNILKTVTDTYKSFCNLVKRVWQNVAGWTIYQYNSLLNWVALPLAKRKALRKHKKYNKQFHVMPWGERLKVVDNAFIKRLNHYLKKEGKPKIDIFAKSNLLYYSTPSSNRTKV